MNELLLTEQLSQFVDEFVGLAVRLAMQYTWVVLRGGWSVLTSRADDVRQAALSSSKNHLVIGFEGLRYNVFSSASLSSKHGKSVAVDIRQAKKGLLEPLKVQ